MKKFSKFFIATIVAMLISSAILSVTPNISEAKKSSLEELRAQQQERQQQLQQQQKGQSLQTQAVTTQSVSEKKPITTADIADNAVTTPKIKDGVIANGAVTKEKLNPNAVKLVVIQREGEDETIPPHSEHFTFATCNSDEVEQEADLLQTQMLRLELASKAGNGWGVTFFNAGDNEKKGLVDAECAHLELGP